MSDTRNPSLQSNLPKLSLLATPKYLPTNEDKIKAANLLSFIINANYEKIDTIWKMNPRLMFVEIQDKDGIKTTPLKRAFYLLDTYTWKPFFEWLQNIRPDFLAEFYKQKIEQKNHLNVTPFIKKSYSDVRNAYSKWSNAGLGGADDDIDNLNEKLFALGEMQESLLPKHMLNEFFRKGDNWNIHSTFDTNKFPPPLLTTKIDSEEALYRGVHTAVYSAIDFAWNGNPGFLSNALLDEAIFMSLYQKRKSDLKSIPTLDMSAESRNTMRALK